LNAATYQVLHPAAKSPPHSCGVSFHWRKELRTRDFVDIALVKYVVQVPPGCRGQSSLFKNTVRHGAIDQGDFDFSFAVPPENFIMGSLY